MTALTAYRAAAVVTTLCGLVCHLAASKAERYHARRFSRHTSDLRVYADREDETAISEEIREFHDDRRLDLAVATMQWGYPLSIAFFLGTGALLLAEP